MPGENYDWTITLKKFFTGLAYAGIPFLLTYSIGFLETETFPVEYAGWITLFVGVLHLLSNLVKHWND